MRSRDSQVNKQLSNTTCYTVVGASVEHYPVLLPQLLGHHLVVQDGVPGRLIVRHSRLPEPHEVDVHVGGAHPELADVLVQGVALKPHGAEEGDLGKLVVEHILPIDDPHS